MISTTLFGMWLKSLWDKFAYYIMAAGIFAGSLLYMLLKGRSEGRAKLKEQLRKADEKAAVKTEKIKRNVEKASDKDINRRLDRWYRD